MNLPVRHIAALLAAQLLVASCGSESDAPEAILSTSAAPRDVVEVRDAAFVKNHDGSATLAAQIVNRTQVDWEIYGAHVGDVQSEGPLVRVFHSDHNVVAAGKKEALGEDDAPARIRVLGTEKLGDALPLRLELRPADNPIGDSVHVAVKVPLVERSAEHDDVVGNEPNTAITVQNARVVVVPGQKKAYVAGTVVATIDDSAWQLPTAEHADGRPARYRHQTATGGPYGIFAVKGKKIPMGSAAPYEEFEGGDADYFDAKDLTVGETITVTIPFQSGDVVVPFEVVAR